MKAFVQTYGCQMNEHDSFRMQEVLREQGNEITVLDAAVQKKAKKLGISWAEKQAKSNPWFDKVLKHQRAFEAHWKDASHYRNVISD